MGALPSIAHYGTKQGVSYCYEVACILPEVGGGARKIYRWCVP